MLKLLKKQFESIFKPKYPSAKKDMVEYCVLCGKKTEYTIETPVDKRIGYIEGTGQLCRECYMDTYQTRRT